MYMLPFRKFLATKDQRLKTGGFTLIEMLVVIAIISILIGIGINTFTIAQKKARDVRRKADLRQIQTYIVLYTQDHGGIPGNFGIGKTYSSATNWVGTDDFAYYFVPNYTSSLPVDPINNGRIGDPNAVPVSTYSYNYIAAANTQAWLFAVLENKNDPDSCYSQSLASTPKNPNVDCTGITVSNSGGRSGAVYQISITP